MINPLNDPQVRDAILKKGYEDAEATVFLWEILQKHLQIQVKAH